MTAAFDLKNLDRVDINEVRAEMARRHLREFVALAWPYMDPLPFMSNWHIDAICDHLEAVSLGQIRRLIINAPPRCAKSLLSSVAWPAWVWAQDDEMGKKHPLMGAKVRWFFASYAQNLSSRDANKMRRLIGSPWYRKWFGHYGLADDQNEKRKYDTTQNGFRFSTTIEGQITGEGGDCLPAGAMVSTPCGLRPIEALKPGESVYTFVDGHVVATRIVATAAKSKRDLYEIATPDGHRLRCTGDHRVFVEGRGYVRADQLRPGWRLVVCGAPQDHVSSGVRCLQRASGQTSLRYPQGPKERLSVGLLQRGLPSGRLPSSVWRQARYLRAMWRRKSQEIRQILLASLSTTAPQSCQVDLVPCMSGEVSHPYGARLLLKTMRKQGALDPNDRIDELELPGAESLFSAFQINAAVRASARRFSMCFVRPSGRDRLQEEAAIDLADTPHQRESTGQPRGEPDHALPGLPQNAPPWAFATIASIVRHGDQPQRVYDIQVARGHSFFAEGVLVHNCRVVDDPHNVQEAESDATRNGVIEWWDEAMPTRINDPLTYADVINMQRVHDRDLSGHILANKNKHGEWVHLCLPMEMELRRRCHTVILPGTFKVWEDPRTKEGELLHKARFTKQSLVDLQMNAYATAGQLQQRPTPRGGALFKTDNWQKWEKPKYPAFEYVVASLDGAYTEDKENDYSAFTVWGIWRNAEKMPQAMLVTAWHERLEIHDLVVKAGLSCAKYKVDRVLIEAKASGISAAQEIRRLFRGRNFAVKLEPVKGDKVARAHSVTPFFEDKLIWAPPRAWAQLLIDEAASFPKGEHDDLVDSMVQALRHFRKTGMLRRTEEELRESIERSEYIPPQTQPLYDV